MSDDLLKRARQIHRTDSREIIEELAAALESDRALLQEAQAEVLRVRDLIDRDRTGLAQAIDEMVKEAQGRLWIVEGRGSYEWDDERYRKEAGHALKAIVALGKAALLASGKLADAAFHTEREHSLAEGVAVQAEALLHSLGEYVRQTMDSNPEWRDGVRGLENAIRAYRQTSPAPAPLTNFDGLESDRALLGRIVEAWDVKNDIWERERRMDQVIDEARARIGEGK